MTLRENLEKGLYFVHHIYTDIRSDTLKSSRHRLILIKESMEAPFAVRGYEVDMDETGMETEILQGSFVYFDGQKLIPANDDSNAIMYAEINRQLTNSINYRNYGNQPQELSGSIADVCSYHVQLGNKNSSIIAVKEDGKGMLFMVDCPVFDLMNGMDYSENLDACMEQIRADFQTDKISKLLISHLHYDRINGIEYLIQKGWLDKDTEIWMNTKYPWKSAAYSRILAQLSALGVRFIEPVVNNSTKHIRVLYPNVSFDEKNKAPGEDIDNALVVYQVCFHDKQMLFLGDIGGRKQDYAARREEAIAARCFILHNGKDIDWGKEGAGFRNLVQGEEKEEIWEADTKGKRFLKREW